MTGRESFREYHKVISFLAILFSVFGKVGNGFLLNFFRNTNGRIGLLLRYIFLKNTAQAVGINVSVQPGVYLLNIGKLRIGDNVSIHPMCYLDAEGGIEIANDVSIAHGSSILSANHSWDNPGVSIKYNKVKFAKVTIHNDVWIGCGVRILAGVQVGSRSVIAAGSIVNKNVESNTIVAGVPAKIVKSI